MLENIDIIYIQEKLELSINIIKKIFILLFIYYTNFKITNKKINVNNKQLIIIPCILIIAITCELIKIRTNFLISTIYTILMISIMYLKVNGEYGTLTTIVSTTINYIIMLIAIIIGFIFNTMTGVNNNWINLVIIVLSYAILLYRFFKIKKFKYGISFLKNNEQNEYMEILILNISAIILFSITLISVPNVTVIKNISISIIIFAIIMFITIQKSFQLYYKQKLLVQELEQTKSKLIEKTEEVENLEKENIKISKNAHTLVHKQKSLEYKIAELAMKTEISKEEAGEIKDRLEEIGKDLYKEKTTIELDKTGISQIDDMLKYMQSECRKNKIDFELQLKGNIHYMTNNLISKEDLETLLADHIKNAIIAINHTDNVNKSILVRLGKIDETYGLYIYDSGAEFKQETLENLGKRPSTTHADEGGTGMGFMNTFDTLRKCNASLIIEEYNEPSRDNYTKVLLIKFDGKNEFDIKSYNQNKKQKLSKIT